MKSFPQNPHAQPHDAVTKKSYGGSKGSPPTFRESSVEF